MEDVALNNTNGTLEMVPAQGYIISTVYIVICVFGLTGNALAMTVVLHNPGLKIASTVFIFNLALADFFFLLSIPFSVANILMMHWVFKGFMCKVYYSLFGINLFASVYTLVAMSLDRYIAVCCMKWNDIRTRLNSIVCCVAIWIAATLLTLPLLLYARMDETGMHCSLMWPQNEKNNSAPAFIYYTMILGFMLPLLLIIVFYTSIIIRLRRQNPGLTDSTLVNKKRRTRKVTFVVFCIILAFAFCWLPYWCVQLVFLQNKSDHISDNALIVYHCATVLYICNSAINPILYGFFSNKFREGVVHVFKCRKGPSRDATFHSSRMTTIHNTLRVRKGSCKKRQDVDMDTNYKLSTKTLKEESHLLSNNLKTNEENSVKTECVLQQSNDHKSPKAAQV